MVGATLTAFAVGGPLIVLFLLARNLGRRSVRGAMALFLLVIAGIGVIAYASTGLYNAERLTLVALVLIPSFVGFALGGLLIQRMNEQDISLRRTGYYRAFEHGGTSAGSFESIAWRGDANSLPDLFG